MSRRSKSSDFSQAIAFDIGLFAISTQGIWGEAIVSSIADPTDLPVDPLFGEQENLFGAQNSASSSVHINVAPVWALGYSGKGISIGVYDTALDVLHADLAGNIAIKRIGAGDPVYISETGDEHATSVAGIIGAARNGIGIVGIAHESKITPINIFDEAQRDSSYVWNALKQQTQFQITNHSWSFTGSFAANPLVKEYAAALSGFTLGADKGRGGLGTIENVAAGNYRQLGLSTETNGLTIDRHVVVVGATDHLGSVAYYSNPGASLLIVAPSSDTYGGITTTDVTGAPGYSLNDYTSTFGGTSAATPQISGIEANMLQANARLGWRDVQKILAVSATHTGSDIGDGVHRYEVSPWIFNAAQSWNGGGLHFSNDYGFGMADAYAAVLIAEDWFKAFAAPNVSRNELSTSGTASGSWDVGRGQTTDIQINIGADQTIEAMVLNLHDLKFSVGQHLTIDLISPNGTVSRLLDQNGLEGSYIANGWQLLSRSFFGENAFGTWTVRIQSAGAGDIGSLTSVGLTAYGSSADDKSVFFYTDEYARFWTVERSILDYRAGPATIFASAITGAILLDLRAGSGFLGDGAIAIADGTYVQTIITGDADNELIASDLAVRFFGGRGMDRLIGGAGHDVIDGGAGDDTIDGGAGNDLLFGDAGVDTVSYASATSGVTVSLALVSAQKTGGAGVDTLSGFENLTGSDFDDTLTGNQFANILDGGAGDDVLIGGAGADIFIGGVGTDTVSYAAGKLGVTIDLGSGIAFGGDAAGDTFHGIENIIGTAAADTITGDGNDNTLIGGAGDDVLSGAAGDDLLIGGAGADTLFGGAGTDTISYEDSRAGVFIDLAAGTATGGDAKGDTFSGIENVIGSRAADTLIGDDGDNELFGLAGNDTLIGGAGADRLDGGLGIDTASYINATSGVTVDLRLGLSTDGDILIDIENLLGGNFNDRLTGDSGNNRIDGGSGDDVIAGGMGNDVLLGGLGIDTVSYHDAEAGVVVSLAITRVQQTRGAGADTLSGFENIVGSAFADVLTGDKFANELHGEDGDDLLIGGAGADVLNGGAGIDTASYASGRIGVIVSLRSGFGQGGDAEGDTLFDIENLIGSSGADQLSGDGGDNILDGGAGNDILFGDDGDDILIGGAGADALHGGEGRDAVSYVTSRRGVSVDLALGIGLAGDAAGDTFTGIEDVIGSNAADLIVGDGSDNVLSGLGGNDVLIGGAGADILDGGGGIDTASYATSAQAVWINLATNLAAGGDAEGDRLFFIENLIGSSGNDHLTGDDGANRIDGGAGDDIIDGGAGNDVLIGNLGIDTVSYASAQSGVTVSLALKSQQQTGGAGADTLSGFENLSGSNFNDVLTGDANSNVLSGGAGDDVLIGGAGADILDGGDGSDTVSYATSKLAVSVDLELGLGLGGDAQGDTFIDVENVIGSKGADTLIGDAGNNTLIGLAGNDILIGGAGDDVLEGGAGLDVLTGGSGADAFYFAQANAGADTITDFSALEGDVIRISKAGFGINADDFEAYLMSGAGVTANAIGHGQFLFDSLTSQLFWDADGANRQTPTLIAILTGVHELTSAHFDFV
jgi:Ca2+-binding RTX toxin-like protein